MPSAPPPPPPLLLLLLLLLLPSILSSIPVSYSMDETRVLFDVKSALSDSRTVDKDGAFVSWIEGNDKCNFTGVTCDDSGSVTAISLSRKGLAGVVPFGSICELRSLQKLDMGNNSLYGNVSGGLKNCTRLKHLDLGYNHFIGEAPDLSGLIDLEVLNLNRSGLSGTFPWTSLRNMSKLSFLSLGDNLFDESPFPMEVLALKNLYWLYLTNCTISGRIPDEIGNLTLLENLELSDNLLWGEIPGGIGRLGRIRQLELYNNSLTGKLPVGLGNLTTLLNFDASTNMLEGDLSVIRSLTGLNSLQLLKNNLSGQIPEELGNFRSLTELSLYENQLTGLIPQNLGSWADFEYIDVSENLLTGGIPPDMCKKGKMRDFLMLQNKLTGGIPGTYANCLSLQRLRVSNNSLSGTVPAGIWGLPNLVILDLAENLLQGPITPDIGRAKSLSQLFLTHSSFWGTFPEEIGNATSLVSIQASFNRFTGGIPSVIGKLSKLNSLDLSANMFSGPIPETIGSCISLTAIDLSNNSLSGNIPYTIGSIGMLNSLNLSGNQLSGEIPASLALPRLSLLDLSNNRLTGQIPESLTIPAYRGSFIGNPGLCSSNFVQFQTCIRASNSSRSLRTVIIGFLVGACAALLFLGCFLFVKSKMTGDENLRRKYPFKQDSWNMRPYRVLTFTEDEIVRAMRTENAIGQGGTGNVYRIVLRTGEQLAVKHILRSLNSSYGFARSSSKCSSAMLSNTNSRPTEFDAEIASLSSIRHVNVVKLYCSITSEDSYLLVYEYLPNGSLWDRLHSRPDNDTMTMLEWRVRYEIALGAARGLEYLHHGCARPIIHRDVKSSNILLDEHWKPRIADFGLAKIMQTCNSAVDWTRVIVGTHGYIAPEYAYSTKIMEKSDVYSFGVVLMELVTGKRPIEAEFGEGKDIVFWVTSRMSREMRRRMAEMVDPRLSGAETEDAIKVLQVAVRCTAKFPTLRPSMRTVVQMLEEIETRASMSSHQIHSL
ncbi:hypothetical protein MLD38_022928 [Melastoma candidum]|uniref:Uncharacterized protein n=1 Tax=Melastoma candidum TaxID=119954 RepID=A0ACB9QPC2_9MYRT|nr:hypothetical protein MLD38_022928 [Melastoma candidum]